MSDPRFRHTNEADVTIGDGHVTIVDLEDRVHELTAGTFEACVLPFRHGLRAAIEPADLRDVQIRRADDAGPGYIGKIDERDPRIAALISMGSRYRTGSGDLVTAEQLQEARDEAFRIAGDDPYLLGLVAAADHVLSDRLTDEYKSGVIPRNGPPTTLTLDGLDRLAPSAHPGILRLQKTALRVADRHGGRPNPAESVDTKLTNPWMLVGQVVVIVGAFVVGLAAYLLWYPSSVPDDFAEQPMLTVTVMEGTPDRLVPSRQLAEVDADGNVLRSVDVLATEVRPGLPDITERCDPSEWSPIDLPTSVSESCADAFERRYGVSTADRWYAFFETWLPIVVGGVVLVAALAKGNDARQAFRDRTARAQA